MADDDKERAKEHAGRAGRQLRHAARNAGEAAEAEAEYVKDEVSEAAQKVSVRGLAALTGDTGIGFLALAVSLYSGTIAYNQFRSVIQRRGKAVSS